MAHRPQQPHPALEGESSPLDRWLLLVVTALLVARPFTPGVAYAAQGHGVLFVVLWIAALALWWVGRLKVRAQTLQWGRFDAAVFLLMALHASSALVGMVEASPRPGLNMFWHWTSTAAAYFLVRQLFVCESKRAALVSALVAVAVGMAVVACYQRFVELPAVQAEYRASEHDPEALLRLTGQWLPEGSPQRMRFEDRLFSSDPHGTFALANRLGGFLAMWLVFPAVLLARWRSLDRRQVVMVAAVAFVLVFALVLTKSRSALAASVVAWGMLLIAPLLRRVQATKWLVLLPVVASGVAAVLIGLFSYDRTLFTDAGKSLGYRWQYWQSTWAMVQDRLWFGWGPGQFQDAYTAYKLPAASEEIADPHNFLLEVWSTAGSGALIALLIVCAVLMVRAWRSLVSREGLREEAGVRAERIFGCPSGRTIVVGTAAGLVIAPVLAFVAQQPVGMWVWLLAVVAAGLSLLLGRYCRVADLLPGVGLAALVCAVHWLAAGGISDPALATGWWTLLALCVPPGSQEVAAQSVRQRTASALGLAATLAALWLAYDTTYRPVLGARRLVSEGQSAVVRARPGEQLQTLLDACALDPRAVDPPRHVAQLVFTSWESRPDDQQLMQLWRDQDAAAIRLAPRSARLWREASGRLAAAARLRPEPELFGQAIVHANRAVELYPTEAEFHLHLGELLQADGQFDRARTHFTRCVELDDLKREAGHADKLLDAAARARAERLLKSQID